MDEKRIIDFRQIDEYCSLLNLLQKGNQHIPLSLPRSARLPFMDALQRDLDRNIVFITSRPDRLLSMQQEFKFWSPVRDHLLFAEPAPLFYENAGWDADTRRERLKTLVALASRWIPGVHAGPDTRMIFTSAKSLMTRTIARRKFLSSCRQVQVGDYVSLDGLIKHWISNGYGYSDIVVSEGQFSRRGGLADFWPVNHHHPIRIEFFGDRIETMRIFDPASQRSLKIIEQIIIPPGSEALLLPASEESEQGGFDNSEYFLPALQKEAGSLLDYLPPNSLILLDNAASISATANELEEQAVKNRYKLIQNGEPLGEEFPVPYFTWSEIYDELSRFALIDLGFPLESEKHPLSNLFSPSPRFGGKLEDMLAFLRQNTTGEAKVFIVSKQTERIMEIAQNTPGGEQILAPVILLDGSLNGGWRAKFAGGSDIILLTDSELFGWERALPRRKRSDYHEAPEYSYADLKPGEYVVHTDYGIGKFTGLVHRALGGVERDYLLITYAEDDQLFVPVHQADRLSLYIGPDERTPRLTRLGSADWQHTKNTVRGAVQQVAVDLLELYAKRKDAKGFAYQADSAWQKILEASFPYDETPDQKQAIEDVKRDLESLKPMDRLLCGDVGYGKTEVALRAAFKVVMNGKQAALLVPTTVLAQQHYETFKARLAPFPVKIEMLSRFRSQSEQEEILLQLALGEVDIVVGTHRLLQADVDFKDLGLIIIDEEQRFGVTHKEFFKKKRTEIDVLTLTATPIPRTLYMSLAGIRDISVINSPPSDRLPIHTYAGAYDDDIVRQAVTREIDRGGQIFFVHNRVQTIAALAHHVQKLVPEARVGIAHGQMPEKELAEVMRRFTSGEVDVLISTSIIESGLDIPNANTLIVDRGDAFGLSQLYQLRGRVGRGASRAYAYFFHHQKNPPTSEGLERLETIAENTQLGAGYSIAMRDLEIRGAGDILGTLQHGHIASVGFHLYTRLLSQAVTVVKKENQLWGEFEVDIPGKSLRDLVSVDLPISLGIPMDYIPDDNLRLQVYRRIADISQIFEIQPLKDEFLDRFGDIPVDLENLFTQVRIQLKAEACGLASVSFDGNFIIMRFPPLRNEDEQREIPDLQPSIRKGKNAYWIPLTKGDNRLDLLESALDELITQKKTGNKQDEL